MNVKGFFVTALSQAVDLAVASPDDVLRHVTPEVLAEHLPRPLWARLLTACMGAPRVDSQLVVETIGVPNLCEHVPIAVIWGCINEIAQRTLGQEPAVSLTPPIAVRPRPVVPLAMTPPPAEKVATPVASTPPAVGPSIPAPGLQSLADVVASLEADTMSSSSVPRSRTPTSQRFRNTNTGIGRLAATNARRPQASAPVADPVVPPGSPQQVRRGSTEADALDIETEIGKNDWKSTLAVEDEQLVDWSVADETAVGENTRDDPRKR